MNTVRLEQAQSPSEIIGNSSKATHMRVFGRLVAKTDATVFLTGETGSGKDRLAEYIHETSELPGKFVPVVCGSIPKELMESVLFGHERGSFTGAAERRIGLFEQADNGTIFINEVDSMPLHLQVSLLRFTEGKSIRRLGGYQELTIKTRLIVGTNSDPEALVARGEFRGDLWHRLNVIRYHVPPLRERLDDIPVLTKHFLERYGAQKVVSEAAFEAMKKYPWPGNIRELHNAIQRGIFYSSNDQTIKEEDLMLDKRAVLPAGIALNLESWPKLKDLCDDYVALVLEKVDGSQTEAAKILGIGYGQLNKRVQRTPKLQKVILQAQS